MKPSKQTPSDAMLPAARRFLANLAPEWRVVITCHGDADGLGAAVLLARGLERKGLAHLAIVPAGKGQHVHERGLSRRLAEARPQALVVLDMGSRGQPVRPAVPLLLVDHHQPHGFPPGAVVLSSHADRFVAPTSLLVYRLLEGEVDLDDLGWLALVGIVGDLGAGAAGEEPETARLLRKWRRKDITETVALVNAAKRSARHDVDAALAVLEAARSPAEIASGQVPGVDRLAAYRREVRGEVDRCGRTAPKFANGVALVRVRSPAQVHPLLAARWARRLKGYVVIAANDDYLPGRVNFSVRTTRAMDLPKWLRELPAEGISGEFAFGHAQATGGSLARRQFERLLRAMGFAASPAPRAQRKNGKPRS